MSEKLLKQLCKKYPPTKEDRLNSFELFEKTDFPRRKEKGWENTDIKFNLEKLNYDDGNIGIDISEEDKRNVSITPLEKEDKIKVGQLIEQKDKLAMMHNALWSNGFLIEAKKDADTKKPVEIRYSGKGKAILNHQIISVEDSASLTVIEKHESEKCLRNDAVELYLGKDSHLDFYCISDNKGCTSLYKLRARLGEGSRLNVFFSFSGKNSARHDYKILLQGKNSQSSISGIYVGEENVFDITTDVVHIEKNTSSDILVKGVLKDNANTMHRGNIKILKDASNTNSFLEGRSLMLGQGSASDIIPSLEIDTNDVKASHAATVGRPDEEEIFYLMSRGLSKENAEKLITSGFFAEIIDKIPEEKRKAGFTIKGDVFD